MPFLSLLLAATMAHAIENLPCQRSLDSSSFVAPDRESLVLSPNQIVVRGQLTEHWETGMEDQTLWGLIDDHTLKSLSSNAYDALHPLDINARIYVLDSDDKILHVGFHAEVSVPGIVTYAGREIEVAPNRPSLRLRPESEERVLSDKAYMRAFKKGAPAVAILDVNSQYLARLDQTLAPMIAAAAEFKQADPDRLIDIGFGSNQIRERAHFETVLHGRLEIRADRRVRLQTEQGPERILPGDQIYLIGANGEAIGSVDNYTFPADLKGNEAELAARADRVVLIRRLSKSNYADTDF